MDTSEYTVFARKFGGLTAKLSTAKSIFSFTVFLGKLPNLKLCGTEQCMKLRSLNVLADGQLCLLFTTLATEHLATGSTMMLEAGMREVELIEERESEGEREQSVPFS